ncbi:MAG: DNA polymerase III subunit gamma/tau [Nannocystaceae bacterium]
MSYVVLARKYRPMRFADMVGQEHIGRTLGNAIKQDRVHHAYLFAGARGLGKTTTARIFAKGLVCEQGPTAEPCNVCSECVAVSESRSVDVMEVDGASNNSVDNIRNLREQVHYLPQTARRKVYIIDEVHMLTTSAFNALLKTLEEPPPHVNFVFATTEPQKVLPTILSRVNRLDFKRVSPTQLVGYLRSILDQEGLSVDDGGLRIVARAGEGSVRDALTLLDQVIAFSEDPNAVGEDEVRRLLGQADAGAVHGLVDAILDRDASLTMQHFDALVSSGHDLSVLSLQVLEHLRDLAVVRVCNAPSVMPDATEAELAALRAQAAKVDSSHLGQLFDRFSRVIDRLPQSRSQRLLIEMGLLDLACAEPAVPLGDLVERLQMLGRGSTPPPASGGASSHDRGSAGRGAPGRGRPSGGARAQGAAEASFVPPPRQERAPEPSPSFTARPELAATPPPFTARPEPEPAAAPPTFTARPESAATPPAPAAAPLAPPRPAPAPVDSFAAKLLDMAVQSGALIQDEPEGAPAAEQQPSPGPSSRPSSNGHGQPHDGSNGAAIAARAVPASPPAAAPATAHEPIRMGVGPCLPSPPADGVVPWEELSGFEAWAQLVARIRNEDEFLAAVLGEVGLVELAGGVVKVASPRGSFAHTELVRNPQRRAQVEQACRDHLGAPFTVELVEGDPVLPELPSLVLESQRRRAEHRAQVEAEARTHPTIQTLLQTFDAALVGTKPLHEA